MATLHLLGTGAALADGSRTTTMLGIAAPGSLLLIDCGGDVVQRALACGLDLDALDAMLLTHEHPDHVSGFPLFMEKLWLAGRRRPIAVHGPATALDQARRIFDAFDTSGWEGLPEVEWREVALQEGAPVLESDLWRVTAAPGEHSVPVVGFRVEDRSSGGSMAYSADTAKSASITRLAEEAGILVHEAGGDHPSHTTAAQAAEVARDAGARTLVLVHLPADFGESEISDARRIFPETRAGSDGDRIDF
jgi:ribonuclease Z